MFVTILWMCIVPIENTGQTSLRQSPRGDTPEFYTLNSWVTLRWRQLSSFEFRQISFSPARIVNRRESPNNSGTIRARATISIKATFFSAVSFLPHTDLVLLPFLSSSESSDREYRKVIEYSATIERSRSQPTGYPRHRCCTDGNFRSGIYLGGGIYLSHVN